MEPPIEGDDDGFEVGAEMNDAVIGGNFAEEWGVLVKGGAWGGDEGNESG